MQICMTLYLKIMLFTLISIKMNIQLKPMMVSWTRAIWIFDKIDFHIFKNVPPFAETPENTRTKWDSVSNDSVGFYCSSFSWDDCPHTKYIFHLWGKNNQWCGTGESRTDWPRYKINYKSQLQDAHENLDDAREQGKEHGFLPNTASRLECEQWGQRGRTHGHILARADENVNKTAQERSVQSILKLDKKINNLKITENVKIEIIW